MGKGGGRIYLRRPHVRRIWAVVGRLRWRVRHRHRLHLGRDRVRSRASGLPVSPILEVAHRPAMAGERRVHHGPGAGNVGRASKAGLARERCLLLVMRWRMMLLMMLRRRMIVMIVRMMMMMVVRVAAVVRTTATARVASASGTGRNVRAADITLDGLRRLPTQVARVRARTQGALGR